MIQPEFSGGTVLTLFGGHPLDSNYWTQGSP